MAAQGLMVSSYSCDGASHRPHRHVWGLLNIRRNDTAGQSDPNPLYTITFNIDRVNHHTTAIVNWQGWFNVVSQFGGGNRRATFRVTILGDAP